MRFFLCTEFRPRFFKVKGGSEAEFFRSRFELQKIAISVVIFLEEEEEEGKM